MRQSPTSYVSIHNTSNINGNAHISGVGRFFVGKWCAIGYGLTVATSNHDYTGPNMQSALQDMLGCKSVFVSRGDVRIGHACWIGHNVTILDGVYIGDGCVVGAGSVVTKNLPPFSVCVGNPCKFLKWRFSERVRAELRELRWWDWSWEEMVINRRFFDSDLTKVDSVWEVMG